MKEAKDRAEVLKKNYLEQRERARQRRKNRAINDARVAAKKARLAKEAEENK